MSDPYGSVASGSLKLKGVSDPKIKKKKKRREKELKKMMEATAADPDNVIISSGEIDTAPKKSFVEKRTKAELAFERVKEKRQEEEIFEKASKTHKDRIMDFNRHLDNLTEHFDIPKVSWTK